MKVLIVKISALGDIIHSLPVAMAIKRQRPQAVIDWVVEAPSYNLLQGHEALRRVFLSPRHALRANWQGNWRLLPAFIRQLRAERYDAVLDLQGLMKSSLFVLLSRGNKKIGFKGGKEPLAAWPLNVALPPYDIERHALDRYLDLLAPLGFKRPAMVEYGLKPKDEYMELWRGRLAGLGPLVVMHPVAKWDTKLWPEEHWAALIRALIAAGARVALSGALEDRAVNARIMQLAGTAVLDLSGCTSLQELMAVLALADTVVSTDTGVMHLAAALKRPLVALFGPTAPNRTGPYGMPDSVQVSPAPCRPCFKRVCMNPQCMVNLSPGQVAAAVLQKLKEMRQLCNF